MMEISFGEWLSRRRKLLGLTQQQLAEQINCATITVRKIEAQQRRPSIQIAEQLCRTLDLPINKHDAFIRFARGLGQLDPIWTAGAYPWHSSGFPTSFRRTPRSASVHADDQVSFSVDEQFLDSVAGAYRLDGPPVDIKSGLTFLDSEGLTANPPEGSYVLLLVPIKMLDQSERSTIRSVKTITVSDMPGPGESKFLP